MGQRLTGRYQAGGKAEHCSRRCPPEASKPQHRTPMLVEAPTPSMLTMMVAVASFNGFRWPCIPGKALSLTLEHTRCRGIRICRRPGCFLAKSPSQWRQLPHQHQWGDQYSSIIVCACRLQTSSSVCVFLFLSNALIHRLNLLSRAFLRSRITLQRQSSSSALQTIPTKP